MNGLIYLSTFDLSTLMPEMPHARRHHCDVVRVGYGDRFRIAHRAARLRDGGDAGLSGHLDRIGEGEERIGGHHRSDRFFARAFFRDADTIDTVGLPATDANRRFALREYN
jgi:hypothetical protein